MPVQQALSFNDLPALNSSPQSVKARFSQIYGKDPDGISVNSETYFNAVTPAITQQYGHPCYKTLGEITYTEAGTSTPTDAIVGSNYAVNEGNEDATITLTVTGEWSETQTYSSSVTVGMQFSMEITLEGVFKLGEQFNISTTVGQSNSQTLSKTASSSVSVTVPARSKKLITMVATLQTETMNFSAPITAQGMFGANFPDRVQGHYFWFADASQVLAATSGQLTGSIQNTAAMKTQTNIGAAEPLSAQAVAAKR